MSLHRACAFFSIVFMAASLDSASSASDLIGSLTDPENPSIDAGLDIVAARIEQSGGRLTFFLETRGGVPTNLPGPDDVMTYLWFLDTDGDAETGQPHGEIGSEFNVRAVVGETYGGGFVDVTGEVPGGGEGEVAIEGNTIRITVWLSEIGDAEGFDWRCASSGEIGGSPIDGNDDTAIDHSGVSPYTPPARVTVTTPILELCASGPATGQLQVVIRDAEGNVLPNDEYVLTFRSTNESVATVDGTGLVHAWSMPEYHWQRPYIEVWADGILADNSAVVRVNSADHGLVHEMYAAEHVTFAVVPELEGVDLDSITTHFEVVETTERAYEEEATAVGTVPVNGGMEYLVLDVADDPQTCVCGASGNPVCLGWLWGEPLHNSCYIANDDPENRVPQWFVYFHEMGHNFTMSCNSFNMFLSQPSETQNTAYCEGLASLAGLWCWQEIAASPGGIGQAAAASLSAQFQSCATNFRQALSAYEGAGADYDAITPDALDGILLEMNDAYGLKAWFDLYRTFLPETDPLSAPLDTKEKQASWFVAAMSASCGADLRALFESEYGFPIDESAWPEILAAVEARVAQRTWSPVGVEEPAPQPPRPALLLSSAPNPFRPRTELRFALETAGMVDFAVYDVLGRRVRALVSRALSAGAQDAEWDGCDQEGRPVAAGIYVARLVTVAGTSQMKLTVLR